MIDYDRPVRVFKNLRYRCYSIMQAGRVRASAREVRLANVEFRVREAGRERMLREGRRIVHAFAVGYLVDHVHPDDERALAALEGRGVYYNPHLFPTFVDRATDEPVLTADLVHFDTHGVIYRDEPELELPRAA